MTTTFTQTRHQKRIRSNLNSGLVDLMAKRNHLDKKFDMNQPGCRCSLSSFVLFCRWSLLPFEESSAVKNLHQRGDVATAYCTSMEPRPLMVDIMGEYNLQKCSFKNIKIYFRLYHLLFYMSDTISSVAQTHFQELIQLMVNNVPNEMVHHRKF